MSDEQSRDLANERVNADLQLKVVRGTPRYEFRATGEIEYVPVRRERDGEQQVIGFLWFSDAESAAGYVAHRAFSPESDNLGAVWNERFSHARAEGASPSEAVLGFGALPPGPEGHAVVAERSRAASVAELRAAAGHA